MRLLGMSPLRAARLSAGIVGSAYGFGLPYKVVLCATYRCACRCDFCGIWKRDAEELPAAELVAALAGVPSLSWVDLTGGEIFLRPDYLELCTGLLDRLPRLALFHFPTAGQHGAEALHVARLAAGRGVRTVVTVSLDGPPERHDRLRHTPGAWQRAVETFVRLRREPGVDVFLGTTLVPEIIGDYPQALFASVQSVVPDIRPDEFHVNVMQRSGHYFSNDESPLPSGTEVRRALLRTAHFKGLPKAPFEWLELAYQSMAFGQQLGLKTPLCRALQASFFLGPDGTVHPCHIWNRPLGRIGGERTLRDLLSGPESRTARRLVCERRCPVCWTPCEAYPTMLSSLVAPLTGRAS